MDSGLGRFLRLWVELGAGDQGERGGGKGAGGPGGKRGGGRTTTINFVSAVHSIDLTPSSFIYDDGRWITPRRAKILFPERRGGEGRGGRGGGWGGDHHLHVCCAFLRSHTVIILFMMTADG